MAKERYLRVWANGDGSGSSFCNPIREFGILADTCDGSSPSDRLLVEVVDLTKEEYEKLPEFSGF